MNQALISEDRNDKATLPRTIARSLFKSSAKDLPSRCFQFDAAAGGRNSSLRRRATRRDATTTREDGLSAFA